MTVKDSMQYRSVVVQRHPRRTMGIIAVSALALLTMFGLGYWVAAPGVYGLYRDAANESVVLGTEVAQLQQRVNALDFQTLQLQTRHQIDRAALEMVRVELSRQEQKNAELSEGVRFYRSLMTAEELAQGLNIRLFELVTTTDPRRFQYQLVVEQLARKHATLQGKVRVEVHGTRDGEPVILPLSELDEESGAVDIRLRFKYFQAIDGELTLPAGFQPELVRVVAVATRPKRKEVVKKFPWQVQERLSYVGQ